MRMGNERLWVFSAGKRRPKENGEDLFAAFSNLMTDYKKHGVRKRNGNLNKIDGRKKFFSVGVVKYYSRYTGPLWYSLLRDAQNSPGHSSRQPDLIVRLAWL